MKLTELIDMLSGVSKNGGATGKPREIHLGIRDSAGNRICLGTRVSFTVEGTGDGIAGATVDLDVVCEDRGFLVPDSCCDIGDPERMVGKDENSYLAMFVVRWHGAEHCTTIPFDGPVHVFAKNPNQAAQKVYDEFYKKFQPPRILFEQCIVIDCWNSSTYVYRMKTKTILSDRPETVMCYEFPEDSRCFMMEGVENAAGEDSRQDQ